MKKIFLILFSGMLLLSSCKKFLDINSDPDTPQTPDPTSVMLTQYAAAADAIQFDALWIGPYVQMFGARGTADAQNDWDKHGYNGFTADRGARIWRQAYYGMGKNIEYCISEGKKKSQWDVVGAAEALKAYIFLCATNVHGEIIWNEAFREDSIFFRYDDQDVVYRGLDSLCRDAISYLSRTDVNTGALPLSRGDLVYAGDKARWTKFTYGLLARIYNAQVNKSNYTTALADSVIKFTGLSLANGTDDFLVPHDASRNADANIFGTFRDNLGTLRQSDYMVRLLDGRVFTGANNVFNNRDPRISHMLVASADTSNGNGGYRGSIPGQGDPNNAASTRIRVPVCWADSVNANPGAANFAAVPGKYLFQNKAVFPIMTYSEIQFMRAEAYLRKGDRPNAFTAYRNGINGHFDFINRTSYNRQNVALFNRLAIPAAQRTIYLASGNVKQDAASLQLEDIMQQKVIALYGWGFVETWVDMRKVHYTDQDPLTSRQVYAGMNVPTGSNLFIDNAGKFVYRIRPRYNSEYVWNIYRPAITNQPDFHVIECWFSKP